LFKRIVSSALVFGVVALAPPAHAQSALTCQQREQLVRTLENRYNESLDSMGLQGPELLLEIWSAKDTGSFTVLLTRPNGISCIVASGNNWQKIDAVVQKGVAG
jgi:hypothetical protein